MGIGFLVSLRLNKYTVTVYYYFSFFLFFSSLFCAKQFQKSTIDLTVLWGTLGWN